MAYSKSMRPKLVLILGPTAVGKSDVALDVALRTAAEIVSADSQQVYRHMNIATWKPSPEARQKVQHHLIDVVTPDQGFSAAVFREKALQTIREIHGREKNVIVCGGTGLYLKALLQGIFVGPGRDEELRARLEREAQDKGLAAVYQRLRAVDPEAAVSIHPHDRQRIARALEVFSLTGKKMSQWHNEHRFRDTWCESLKIGLERERQELYALINRRCDEMFSLGLIDELRHLVADGYSFDLKPMQSIGYRHAGLYLRGEANLAEALELMKRDTRHLAKRQLTWFRSDHEIQWFHPERDRSRIVEAVSAFFS
ncbi:MAG: tRNA (adenosine(37)-N6)-dimethylallyltransferase MiaA [Candidatus Binatia bacterium]